MTYSVKKTCKVAKDKMGFSTITLFKGDKVDEKDLPKGVFDFLKQNKLIEKAKKSQTKKAKTVENKMVKKEVENK